MITEMDRYLFHEGTHESAYDFMGAHLTDKGVRFTTWAPHAKSVSVVGDFNHWDGNAHQMMRLSPEGIWEIEIEGLAKYSLYKYQITGDNGTVLKADPFARFAEVKPNTASLVYADEYSWQDKLWLEERKEGIIYEKPISIYEINFASWRKHGEDYYTYREIAEELIPYLKEHFFTHVEFMPVMEHPFDGSWGYQLTGYFAITSRYGTPEDFKYLIDNLHREGIGVILDWVPGHFCKDSHGLAYYDGLPLFEPTDENLRDNIEWGTMNFDYARPEVRSFLISSAHFYFKEFHIDGIRIDAVSYMLHKHMATGRYNIFKPDDYNDAAIDFLKQLNTSIFAKYENILMMAEDSSDYPMVTGKVADGGLGFNYKWNMGWMHDTLKYFKEESIFRSAHQGKLTFSIVYAFNENFLLPLSHDEVVHGKHSLIDKMKGDYWQKFANLRALISYQYCHSGKKLNFMGNEFAQFIEWNEWQELDWHLLKYDSHRQFNDFFKAINELYVSSPELYQVEHSYAGFEWVEFDNEAESIIAFKRIAKDGKAYICVFNFTPVVRENYPIQVDDLAEYTEVFNSDSEKFGGSGVLNSGKIKAFEQEKQHFVNLRLPPLAVTIIKKELTI